MWLLKLEVIPVSLVLAAIDIKALMKIIPEVLFFYFLEGNFRRITVS